MPPRLAPNQHPRNPARFPGPATKTVAAVFAHSRSMASQFHCPQICKDIRIGRPYACSSRCAQRASRSSMCLRSGGAAAFVLGVGAQRIHRCELPGRANASHGGPWDTGLTADPCGSAAQVSGHIRPSARVCSSCYLCRSVCARVRYRVRSSRFVTLRGQLCLGALQGLVGFCFVSRERLMRRALAQTQLPGCLGARTGMPPWWMSLVDVLVRLGMPPRWRSWCWMFVHHTKRSSQTPTDAYAPLYSLGAKALLLWGRAPPLHTPSCHVLAPRREPITCDDGLFIGTNKADDRDGTYTRSGWGLPSPRLRMQSNLQLPPRRANRGCGGWGGRRGGRSGGTRDKGANLRSRFGSWLAILV